MIPMGTKRKLVLFIASSLDGYIAAKGESLEWLFKVEGEGDNGISEFYETVDTILMGKRTYDWLMRQDLNEFPYKDKACFVFTRSSYKDTEHVKFVNDDINEFMNVLKHKDGKNIWMMGGGELLNSFIQNRLIDEIIITVAPTIIGNGTPLFKESNQELELILKSTRQFNQFVELHYEVK